MNSELYRLIVLILGLLILGSLGLLLAMWTQRWPHIRTGFARLGDAAVTFSLGLLGVLIVVIVLRAFSFWP